MRDGGGVGDEQRIRKSDEGERQIRERGIAGRRVKIVSGGRGKQEV